MEQEIALFMSGFFLGGAVLGTVGCLVVNRLWYLRTTEMNRSWAEFYGVKQEPRP